jgi:L-fuconolactonase
MVYVQVGVDPVYALLEARWAADLVHDDPRVQAVVAWAPLEDGDFARGYLAGLAAIDSRIKGVRRTLHTEPDPASALRPGFVRAVQMLPEFDLSCDLCIVPAQLTSATELVRRCPETSFMLDHLGLPDIRAGNLDPWRTDVAALATLPNVMCKISGVVTAADHAQWMPADVAPYILHACDVFGEDRVAFGGDWPVVTQAASYRRWAETLEVVTAHLSPEARHKLWVDNGSRFYRLST